MGQKANPIANRLSISSGWKSQWLNFRSLSKWLEDDINIRAFIEKKYGLAGGIADIQIIRTYKKTSVEIHTARPGIIIGRAGAGISELKRLLESKFPSNKITVDVIEVRKPDLVASLIAQSIGSQIIRRIPYRRAIKNTISRVISAGAKGIKVVIAGRLNGAEIARREKFSSGTVPVGTFRVFVDFAKYDAITTYGVVGIKVWINPGNQAKKENHNVNP